MATSILRDMSNNPYKSTTLNRLKNITTGANPKNPVITTPENLNEDVFSGSPPTIPDQNLGIKVPTHPTQRNEINNPWDRLIDFPSSLTPGSNQAGSATNTSVPSQMIPTPNISTNPESKVLEIIANKRAENIGVAPKGQISTTSNILPPSVQEEPAVNPVVDPKIDNDLIYNPIDMGEFQPDNELNDLIGGTLKDILSGNDPISAQNERMALTGLDRMQANVDQNTARQAAELGIEVGSRSFNELQERNRENISSQGSQIMSNLSAQNMARQERALSQADSFQKGQQQFGLEYGKTVENMNRYGFEAGLADRQQKSQWAEYVMSNPDIFSSSVVGEAKKGFFENMGIDITQLPKDPSLASQARTEIADHVRIAHPDWTDEQINTESTRLFGLFSPYTSGKFEEAGNIDTMMTGDGDTDESDDSENLLNLLLKTNPALTGLTNFTPGKKSDLLDLIGGGFGLGRFGVTF